MILTAPARAGALTLWGQQNNPFFAWDNLAAAATLSGSTAATDGALANAVTGTTYDYYTPTTGAGTVEFIAAFGTAQALTFIGMAAHNLGTLGLEAYAEYSTNSGSSWTDGGAGVASPTDDSPIAWRMTGDASATHWRIRIMGGSSTVIPSIGVAFFGHDLVMPDRFYQGFSPRITPTEVALQSNVSVGNHLLGSSVVYSGSTLSAGFTLVRPDFVRGAFKPFQVAFNEGKPCFFAWRPEKYPEDLHYCWRDGGVIRPQNTSVTDYMSFDLNMRLHDG